MSARARERAKKRNPPPKPEALPLGVRVTQFLHDRWVLILVALVLLHVALALLVLEPAPHPGGDNAGYLTLARSLLERHQYRDLYDPAAPIHTQYPPVFPIILAIALTLGIKPWMGFKLIIIAFSALAIAFTYLWIRRMGRPELAAGVTLVLAVAPGVLAQSHWELSDVPFWGMMMVAVWAWQRLSEDLRGRFIIAVAMTTLAYFTRSAGLPLLVAATLWLILRRRWKQLAIFMAVIGPLAFLWWLRAKSRGGVDYVSQFWYVNPYNPELGRMEFADIFRRMSKNGSHYLMRHLPMLLFGVEKYALVSVLVVIAAIWGWVSRLRHPRIAEIVTPLYIGLLLVWPEVWSGERFLLPAMPFILFYAFEGIVRLTRRYQPTRVRLVGVVVAGLLIAIGVPRTGSAIAVGTHCNELYRDGDKYACLPEPYKDYYAVAEVAPRVLPKNAVVISRKARSFYVISGLPGRAIPLSENPDTFFKQAMDARARYVVFDGMDNLAQIYLAPVLLKKPDAFCLMFGLGPGRATVFGIDLKARNTPEQPVESNEGSFGYCDDTYWRSKAVRDSMEQGFIRY